MCGTDAITWRRRNNKSLGIFKEVKVTEKDFLNFVLKSNKIVANLERKNIIQESKNNYSQLLFQKATNVAKFYLLPKSYKNLSKFPGHPVILNCGIVQEKILRVLRLSFTTTHELYKSYSFSTYAKFSEKITFLTL